MNLELNDKVVIVIWDAMGLGSEISKLLAEEGAIPVIVGTDRNGISEVVKTIHDKKQGASYAITEVTIPENCSEVVDSVLSAFGRIDGLVNNDFANEDALLKSSNYESLMGSIPKYLAHCYPIVNLVLPELKKCNGAFVTIGSKTSGFVATNGDNDELTAEWALELVSQSIRANAVIVSESFTSDYGKDSNTFANSENTTKEVTGEMPIENRMPSGEEIANTVVFLLSDKSNCATGQVVFLDGGNPHLKGVL